MHIQWHDRNFVARKMSTQLRCTRFIVERIKFARRIFEAAIFCPSLFQAAEAKQIRIKINACFPDAYTNNREKKGHFEIKTNLKQSLPTPV